VICPELLFFLAAVEAAQLKGTQINVPQEHNRQKRNNCLISMELMQIDLQISSPHPLQP